MPTLTVRLPDEVLSEVAINASSLHLSKNAYIHKAINLLNHEMNNQAKRDRIIKASQKVRVNSIEINNEFSLIENDSEM